MILCSQFSRFRRDIWNLTKQKLSIGHMQSVHATCNTYSVQNDQGLLNGVIFAAETKHSNFSYIFSYYVRQVVEVITLWIGKIYIPFHAGETNCQVDWDN